MTRLADPALLVALMLLVAIAGGYLGVFLRVPRVVGYLAGGLVLRLVLSKAPGAVARLGDGVGELGEASGQLDGLKTLALGLIMFSMGTVFEAKHIKAFGLRILRIVLLKETSVFVLVSGGCVLLALAAQSFGTEAALALGLLLGVVATATAPAATLLVLREYEAKGHNSDTILSMTAYNNLACIVLFHALFLILSSSGLIESNYSSGRWLWLDLLLTSLGSVVLGVVLGFAFSVLYAKITVADFMLIFLGVALMLGAFEGFLAGSLHLSFNFLLTYLFLGATFANLTPDQDAFHHALRTVSGPIFALFFVLAGFELRVETLAGLGLVGGAYIVLRTLGKTLGGWLGARWTHAPGEIYPYIGFGMLCQAGVAIGLAEFLHANWGTASPAGFQPAPAADAFKTVVLGSVVVFELIGPVALKRTVVAAGEVTAVTLLRRRRTPGTENGSVVRRTWHGLLATLGLVGASSRKPVRDLKVRHIMRSNVKVIPTAARFDEVLRFVSDSRHNHFPVVDEDGQCVGMIHFADLRHIMYDPTVRELVTAHDLSRQDTPLTTPDLPLDDLFELFHATDVGSLVVVANTDSRAVVGIVEQRDLLLAMHKSQRANPSL